MINVEIILLAKAASFDLIEGVSSKKFLLAPLACSILGADPGEKSDCSFLLCESVAKIVWA